LDSIRRARFNLFLQHPNVQREIHIIDSHTGGEPTRVVLSGGPELGASPLAERLNKFRDEQDRFRSAIVNEPRGSDAMVGALLVPPTDPTCAAAVIFFNNVGYLGMCGHGTIGLIVTLAHLGKIKPGAHRIETSVGIVTAILNADGSVTLENVPSFRKATGVKIAGVTGDVAWGGNWFYLVEVESLGSIEELTNRAWEIRQAINAQGFPDVDHVELVRGNRAFVLCPGKAYDRSPCGTGTSAKLACLAANGKLREGETWRQESIIGSHFTATFKWLDRAAGTIIPTITGSAFVNAEAKLILNDDDPFCWGIR
jgi:4-hydroxyproline epimerase